MPGSTTTPGRMGAHAIALMRVAFHTHYGVGTRDKKSFIAVEMAIADHPPHRSERALLTHSAPTSST